MGTLSTIAGAAKNGAGKAWTWLKAHPHVLWLLIGLLLGIGLTFWWYHRHPIVKTEHTVTTVTDQKVVDALNLQIEKNRALTQELAITQNQLIDLQVKKTTKTHTEKKPDGTTIVDTTTTTDTSKKTDTKTDTDKKTAETDTSKTDETKTHVDDTHTKITDTTITTPMVAPRLLLTGAGGLNFSTVKPIWGAGAAFHAGTFLGMDLYPGGMYLSENHTVLLTFTLGIFH